MQHEVFEGVDEVRGIAEGGHHAEASDAEFFGFVARFDVYFVKGLDVLGDERDGDHEHFLDAFVGEALDGGGERRLQPLGGADAALVAEQVCARPVGKTLRSLLAG